MKKILVLVCTTVLFFSLNGQKIQDGGTLNIDGLEVTMDFINKEIKNIKGINFDRFRVSVIVRNNTGKPFNIRLGSTSGVDVSNYGNSFNVHIGSSGLPSENENNMGLIEVNCLNATGARLTSKRINFGLKAHKVNVNYSFQNKDGKYINSVLSAIVGYYLDSDDVISGEATFLVPQGQEPDVLVRKLF
ncbi:hypothetical protein [Chryseobacterium sp. OSA05B]|uniref:hypothetical protein n=1 Tax=Chryseobacterium sp. OSA05B TaxID=2862650 RepID=UPI001CBB9FB6|nr:hypothetical protein [Chryseobacterium sp. OSA05B]